MRDPRRHRSGMPGGPLTMPSCDPRGGGTECYSVRRGSSFSEIGAIDPKPVGGIELSRRKQRRRSKASGAEIRKFMTSCYLHNHLLSARNIRGRSVRYIAYSFGFPSCVHGDGNIAASGDLPIAALAASISVAMSVVRRTTAADSPTAFLWRGQLPSPRAALLQAGSSRFLRHPIPSICRTIARGPAVPSAEPRSVTTGRPEPGFLVLRLTAPGKA